jgi:hypothetical protein
LDAQPIIPNPSFNTRERWIAEINGITTENPNVSTRVEPAYDFYENLGYRTPPTSYDQMTDSEIESLRNHLFDNYTSTIRQRIADENSMLDFDDAIDRDFIDLTTPDEYIFYHEGREVGRSSDPSARVEDFLPRQKTNNIGDKLTKAEKKAKDKINTLIQNSTQSYPYYSGQVEEKVPLLFRSHEKSLTDVSRKVAKQTENIPSGTVYTGSLNTSHNSWLPQVKQVFNYKGGSPQFTGYKPMNSLGYLSKAQVPEEDIVKYLNTEIQNIPCSLYDKKNNILIKFNHYNPNECFDIINSNNDIPTNYNDILVCIHISYLLWIITIIGGFSLFIVKFISEKYEKYDRYKDIIPKQLDSETHII